MSKAPTDYFNIKKRTKHLFNGKTSYLNHHQVAKGYHVELDGDPITSEEDFAYLNRIFSGRKPDNIIRAVLGPEETGVQKDKKHQHYVILLTDYTNANWSEVIELPSGIKSVVYAMPLSEYSQQTNDIENLIKYITKEGQAVKDYKNEENAKKSSKEEKKSLSWNFWIKQAIEYPTWEQAKKALQDKNYEKFLQQEGKIKQQWIKKHSREIDMENTFKENLLPWQDLEELDEIKKWINKAATTNKRLGNLFIVGPTKTGKTEFIIQEAFRKYLSFMLRGDFMWERYDEDKDYKFYIFDDINYNHNIIPQIKALTSSINVPTMVNIKYGHALVKSRPCIHLLNENQFDEFIYLSKWYEGERWWPRNSKVIYLVDRLFKTKAEVEREKLENKRLLLEQGEESMSENSITDFENTPKQLTKEDENNEEEEEENNEEENIEEKSPEKFYSRKNKHSFRSRFKHTLKKLNVDEDTIRDLLDKFDEDRVKNLEDHEAIEYGFDDEDNIEDHPSMQEEAEFEEDQLLLNDRKKRKKEEEEYEDDIYENEVLPMEGRLSREENGIIYD